MSLFQLKRRLQGRSQGPPVLDQLQVGEVHHHHLRQPGGASEDDCQVTLNLEDLQSIGTSL